MYSFGLLGKMLDHSLSPQLFSLIARATGCRLTYGIFQVRPEYLDQAVPSLRALGVGGANVTIPYKQDIIPYIDELSGEARAIGAVNTLRVGPDKTTGYNTDYFGFLRLLEREGIPVRGKRFLLCGMSGAGRAVYRALADAGAAEVLVASTDPQKGIAYADLPALGERDVIVNCTPVGMHPDTGRSVVDGGILGKFGAAVDIVYNPAETEFLRLAKMAGCKTVDGMGMLVCQGIKSFSIWTGLEVPEPALNRICGRLSLYLSRAGAAEKPKQPTPAGLKRRSPGMLR